MPLMKGTGIPGPEQNKQQRRKPRKRAIDSWPLGFASSYCLGTSDGAHSSLRCIFVLDRILSVHLLDDIAIAQNMVLKGLLLFWYPLKDRQNKSIITVMDLSVLLYSLLLEGSRKVGLGPQHMLFSWMQFLCWTVDGPTERPYSAISWRFQCLQFGISRAPLLIGWYLWTASRQGQMCVRKCAINQVKSRRVSEWEVWFWHRMYNMWNK